MYTIAYDETDGFEAGTERRTPATLIGGLIYDDAGEEKIEGKEPERARIKAFYRAVCKKCTNSDPDGTKYHYPGDLHRNARGSNSENVKVIRGAVRNALPEFLRYGTFEKHELIFRADGSGKITSVNDGTSEPVKRRGSYRLTVLYKDTEPEEEIPASNLYKDMAKTMLLKTAFLNPYITDDCARIALNLPTRVYAVRGNDEAAKKRREEYKNYGYRQIAGKDSEGRYTGSYYEVMTANDYQEIVAEAKKFRKYSYESQLYVSIDYKSEGKGERHAFLHLCDSLCDFLDDALRRNEDRDEHADAFALNESNAGIIREELGKLNPQKPNMFFYYDPVDEYCTDSMKAILERNIFKALAKLYEGKAYSGGPAKQYYAEKWLPAITGFLEGRVDSRQLEDAVTELRRYRESDNLDSGLLLYVQQELQRLSQTVRVEKKYLYWLYDVGISAYTHAGQPEKARECYDLTDPYASSVGRDDCEMSEIRMITADNDMFAFEEAELRGYSVLGVDPALFPGEKGEKEPTKRSLMERLKARFFRKEEEELPERRTLEEQITESAARPQLYKALGSLGQTLAFMHDEAAENCFLRVLNDRGEEKDANYFITESYLLHYYIEMGCREKYERYAFEYFNGITDPGGQLSYLIREGMKSRDEKPRFSMRYALFVYIKAFYRFYKDDRKNEQIAEWLIDLPETVARVSGKSRKEVESRWLKGHPFELIYKYAALLEDDYTAEKRGINRERMKRSVQGTADSVIGQITMFGDIQIVENRMKGEPDNGGYAEERDRRVKELWTLLHNEGRIGRKAEVSTDLTAASKRAQLDSCFTYMYS